MANLIKSVIKEVKQVQWPTRREMFTMILFTTLVCAIISLVILGLDVLFLEVREIIFGF